ncbi:unnamed protein product [Darwinula stevensoni]|uniref:Tumor protein D52 n=1 Tax=Darwinula stevensoni TaxID=69355 RepID=A0A7R9AB96_9CRUS|nr:unnamed protein product [Darwinula stevensoni]CAG0898797.1 unnamed protein product [Darwinula stevensoni]
MSGPSIPSPATTPIEEERGYSITTPDSGLEEFYNLPPEEQAQHREEWQQELVKTEEEIHTLRQVLASKMRRAHELKRKLGITPWKEFSDDWQQGIQNFRESQAFQKSTEALKTAVEKTSTTLGGLGSAITQKLGDLKGSTTFRSFEEKVSGAVGAVKSRVTTSRSTSAQDFDTALQESEEAKQDDVVLNQDQLPASQHTNKQLPQAKKA